MPVSMSLTCDRRLSTLISISWVRFTHIMASRREIVVRYETTAPTANSNGAAPKPIPIFPSTEIVIAIAFGHLYLIRGTISWWVGHRFYEAGASILKRNAPQSQLLN